jgi:sarcosine oxidase subunit gamma
MLDRLSPVEALAAFAIPDGLPPGVAIQPLFGLGLATVVARQGRATELSARIAERHGLDLPDGPRLAVGGGVAFLGTAPGAWLAVTPSGHPAWALELAGALEGLASVADQSDAYVAVRVSGPLAEPILARSVGLDLHPGAFPVGAGAVTSAAHLGLILWRQEPEVFEVLAFRSYAESFWHWLTEAALGFDPGG